MNYAQAALREINLIREEYGLPTLAEVPRGKGYGSYTCPLACALEGGEPGRLITGSVGQVSVSLFVNEVWDRNIPTPPAVGRFVTSYDNGRQRKYEPTFSRIEAL